MFNIKIKKKFNDENTFKIITSTGKTLKNLKSDIFVGRDPSVCDLVIKNQTISKKHMHFMFSEGNWFAEDLDSTNGTWINGKKIMPMKPVQLVPGDRICIALSEVFYYKEKPKEDEYAEIEKKLPEKISFFEGMKMLDISLQDVWENWNTNSASRSLKVPVGVKENGEAFYLDFVKELNVLVYSESSSGKTEFLFSLLLALGINYSPKDVSVIWIDSYSCIGNYEIIPHIVGVLDVGWKQEIREKRYIESLIAEVNRRYKILDKYDLRNIEEYIQGYHDGIYETSLPRLLIIMDDAYHVKCKYPELYNTIITISNYGKRVGIHMCYSTKGGYDERAASICPTTIVMQCCRGDIAKLLIGHTKATELIIRGRAYVNKWSENEKNLVQLFFSGERV